MIAIQLVAVQHPGGREHDHVRAFGYRVRDVRKRMVEVALTTDEALDVLAKAEVERKFPELTVPDHEWSYCLNTGDVAMVHYPDKEST